MREPRKGYEWVACSDGTGFWSKVRGNSHKHKRDLFCAHCGKPTGEVDNQYLEDYGFCWECFTLNVDSRNVPTINIEYYRNLKKS